MMQTMKTMVANTNKAGQGKLIESGGSTSTP